MSELNDPQVAGFANWKAPEQNPSLDNKETGLNTSEEKTPEQMEKELERTLENIAMSKGTRERSQRDQYTDKTIDTYTGNDDGLTVKFEITSYYEDAAHNNLDAMGDHLTVEDQGKLVFERSGAKVKLNEPGEWTEKIKRIS